MQITLPEATEVTKLEDKALVDYIYIGPPVARELGTEPLMQLNDQFARLDEIAGDIERAPLHFHIAVADHLPRPVGQRGHGSGDIAANGLDAPGAGAQP